MSVCVCVCVCLPDYERKKKTDSHLHTLAHTLSSTDLLDLMKSKKGRF